MQLPIAAPASGMEKPVQTVYVNNLTDKLSKDKMRRQLFNLFSRFGPVLDVIVKKSRVTRGQAWVVFTSTESATKAISGLQRYPFFEKEMHLNFARENADVVAKLEGKFVQKKREPKPAPAAQAAASVDAPQPAPKKQRLAEDAEEPQQQQQQGSGGGHDGNNPPGPILKTDNLPVDISTEVLHELFGRFEGFKEVRLVPGKFVAFVEYTSMDHARLAREGLKGHQLSETHRLRVNYAKQ